MCCITSDVALCLFLAENCIFNPLTSPTVVLYSTQQTCTVEGLSSLPQPPAPGPQLQGSLGSHVYSYSEDVRSPEKIVTTVHPLKTHPDKQTTPPKDTSQGSEVRGGILSEPGGI